MFRSGLLNRLMSLKRIGNQSMNMVERLPSDEHNSSFN